MKTTKSPMPKGSKSPGGKKPASPEPMPPDPDSNPDQGKK